MISSISPLHHFVAAVLRVFSFGYGRVRFEVNESGDLVEAVTIVTVKMLPRETIQAFHARLRAEYPLRKGDMVEIISQGGKFEVAQLTLHAR